MPRAQQIALAVIILFCCAVVGTLIARDLMREEPAPAVTAAPQPDEKEKVTTAVRVTPTACNRTASGRMRMDGYLTNIGTQPLQFVTVKALWKSSAGRVVGSETFYALNGELAPGEQHSFSHSTELASADRCNAEAVDWW